MAASKKSAKRSSAKKRPAAKSARAKSARAKKPAAKAKAASAKRRPRKTSKSTMGLDAVRQVGERTWETLKSTTAQVVEGVKETFGG